MLGGGAGGARGSGCCLRMRIRCMSRGICRGRCMRRRSIKVATAVVFAAADCGGVLAARGDAAGFFGAGECVSAEAGERSRRAGWRRRMGSSCWWSARRTLRWAGIGRWGRRFWRMWRWRGAVKRAKYGDPVPVRSGGAGDADVPDDCPRWWRDGRRTWRCCFPVRCCWRCGGCWICCCSSGCR